MTAAFSDAAVRWCNFSARLLGWRPDEFWNATPAELMMALADPADPACPSPPSREMIARMMERDAHERQF
ncbi:MAG: phage tail assembly chaperone [Erythrobacter sp.]|nr:phage tail assembly chaperone [Erythrobacter sp.]